MNPGPIEEGGKVAVGVVEGLRSQPLALALVVLNIVWLFAVTWLAHENNVHDDRILSDLIRACTELEKIGG